MKNKRILIVSLQGIGDLLMATPLIKAIKKSFPKSYVGVLTFNLNSEILDNNPYVNEVFKVGKMSLLESVRLLYKIRRQRFDVGILSYPSGLKSASFVFLCGISKRLGHDLTIFKKHKYLFTDLIKVKTVKHAVLFNLDFLRCFNIDQNDSDIEMTLNIADEDKENAASIYRKYDLIDKTNIIVHAGGGKFTQLYRSWPHENYAAACDELIKTGKINIIFIGGKEDVALTNNIVSIMKYPSLNLAGKLGLSLTAALISQADILIGNNSAPMHIAAALKVPTLSIFGCVDERLHHPWGNDYTILQKDMDCCPCYYPFLTDTLKETAKRNSWIKKEFLCRKGDTPCFKEITVSKFVEEVRRKITNAKK
jgi:lipopolysaccharide heptosyltransferase II